MEHSKAVRTVTIRNDFHRTSATVLAGKVLSQATINRVRRTLCGMADCSCGGDISERGPQECELDYTREGLVLSAH